MSLDIAEVRQYLNSTIGTENAQALDQLIRSIIASSTQSPIKSVQRGTYDGSGGYVTINAVNPNKTNVHSDSKGSAGYAAVRGEFQLTQNYGSVPSQGYLPGGLNAIKGTISEGANTSNLTVKVFSARLYNSTTLYCDGPCWWEVTEFN